MFKYAYQVPENKKIRVIVHTDCKNEADDQFALAHHLMTPNSLSKVLSQAILRPTTAFTAWKKPWMPVTLKFSKF